MTDQQQPRPGEPGGPTKPAKPADDGAASPQAMSFSQHVFIWTLVLLVGVLFGVGGSISDVFRHPSTKIAGTDIDEGDAIRRVQVAERLQRILAPGYDRQFVHWDPRYGQETKIAATARRMLIERYADSQGFKPGGRVLDQLVREFLATPLAAPRTGTYQSAINEFRRNREGDVTVPELERYLAEDFAVNAIYARNVQVPPVPLAIAGQVQRAIKDRVEIDEVTLTAQPFVKPDAIDDKDPELARVFDELRNSSDKSVAQRFEKPGVAQVTVAYADAAALAAKQEVSDAEAAAWYEAHKEDYVEPAKPEDKPAEPKAEAKGEAPKAAEKTYKPLEAVKAEIVAKLQREKATKHAAEVVDAFVNGDQAEGLDGQDVAAFRAAATAAGLALTDVEVTEPHAGGAEAPVELPGLGRLKQSERELGLFSRQPGFVSGMAEIVPEGDKPGTWVVLRLNERRERQLKTLEDAAVLAEVKRRLAGRRAYGDFLAAAEKLRAEAEAKGPGGLRAVLESDAGKAAWPDAKVETRTTSALEEIRPPAKEYGGVSDDPKPALAYAMPAAPVALGQPGYLGEVPSARLLQVKSYQAAAPAAGPEREQFAQAVREGIRAYAQREYETELQRKIFE